MLTAPFHVPRVWLDFLAPLAAPVALHQVDLEKVDQVRVAPQL
jgi:hypothetical protein